MPRLEPHQAEIVRDAYDRMIRLKDRDACKRAAVKLGVRRHTVNRWAMELGLSRHKELPWTDLELQALERYGHFSENTIVRKMKEAGYPRSRGAIHLKLKRFRIKQNLDGYSARSLALAFGVDVHWVLRFLNLGAIKGERRGTERTKEQGGDTWWITRQAVKDFVLDYPDEVDIRKVEKWWFLDLLTDGRICR